ATRRPRSSPSPVSTASSQPLRSRARASSAAYSGPGSTSTGAVSQETNDPASRVRSSSSRALYLAATASSRGIRAIGRAVSVPPRVARRPAAAGARPLPGAPARGMRPAAPVPAPVRGNRRPGSALQPHPVPAGRLPGVADLVQRVEVALGGEDRRVRGEGRPDAPAALGDLEDGVPEAFGDLLGHGGRPVDGDTPFLGLTAHHGAGEGFRGVRPHRGSAGSSVLVAPFPKGIS